MTVFTPKRVHSSAHPHSPAATVLTRRGLLGRGVGSVLCLVGVVTMPSSPGTVPASAPQKRVCTPKVFIDGHLQKFDEQHLVAVKEPWKKLLDFIITERERIALIRAPPRSGKSFLGKLAERDGEGVEVRYCSDTKYAADTLLWKGADGTGQTAYPNVVAMARDSGTSSTDDTRRTIVYYFDEAAEIPEEVYTHFIKDPLGYAIFAASSHPVTDAKRLTPTELNEKSFFFKSPASEHVLRKWLQGRFKLLLSAHAGDAEAAAELLLNVANGNIGVIQYLGTKLEEAGARSLREIREQLHGWLTESRQVLMGARCFGATAENGVPDAEQSLLISMLRCCGDLRHRNAVGEDCVAWQLDVQSHRHGFSGARYATVVDSRESLVSLAAKTPVTFTHSLQPEIYHWLFQFRPEWTRLSHEARWLTNFGNGPKPTTNVLNLVVSWLSHVETMCLLNALNKVDAEETVFQNSFYLFHVHALGMKGERDQSALDDSGKLTGYLDHLVDQEMGVEFLIRASSDNRHCASQLLGSETTRKSIKEHASRTDSKYAGIAKRCGPEKYVTVLVGTLTGDVDEEWGHFQTLIGELNSEGAGANYPIMVAVAPFGWAKWHVFLHRPGEVPIKFEIPRQRLMFKLVGDEPRSARHFYPRPTEVWARELVVEGGGALKLTGKAFKVKPEADDVASLAEGIHSWLVSRGRVYPELSIYSLSRTGVWKELEEDQVLYENVKARPYGFVVPRGAA